MFRRRDALPADIVRHNLLFHQGSELLDGRRRFRLARQFDQRDSRLSGWRNTFTRSGRIVVTGDGTGPTAELARFNLNGDELLRGQAAGGRLGRGDEEGDAELGWQVGRHRRHTLREPLPPPWRSRPSTSIISATAVIPTPAA